MKPVCKASRLAAPKFLKKHAGFIINIGNATATDYLDVIHHVQATVFKQFGVKLETEVRIIGEEK